MLTPTATVKVTLDKDVRGGNKTLIGVGANSGPDRRGPRSQLRRQRDPAKPEDLQGLRRRRRRDHDPRARTTSGSTTAICPAIAPTPCRATTASSTSRTARHTSRSRGRCFTITKTRPWSVTRPTERSMAEDSALSVTYHHNLFLKVNSGPRVRWGTAHVFNNHFQDVTSFGVVSESAADRPRRRRTCSTTTSRLPIATTYQDPMSGTMTEIERHVPAPASPPTSCRAAPPISRPLCRTCPTRADSVSAIVSQCAGTGKLKLQQ